VLAHHHDHGRACPAQSNVQSTGHSHLAQTRPAAREKSNRVRGLPGHGLAQQISRSRGGAAVRIGHLGRFQVGGEPAVADVEVGESGNGRLRFGR
jgi:hypothetical protein